MTAKWMDVIKYGKKYAYEAVPNATKIYHGHSVTVAPKARGMGLGKELIRRSMDLAHKRGCSHVYILATSIYSQRIFRDFKFTILQEMPYEDFLDRDGHSCFFQNMNEHKTAQVVLYELPHDS